MIFNMETLLSIFSDFMLAGEPVSQFTIRFVMNIITCIVVIRYIYYSFNGQINSVFSFISMGMMVFLIASLLDKVQLNMGLVLGLFAIFTIIRFRTPPINMKEMSYLFVIIGISGINALVAFDVFWRGLLIANVLVIALVLILENFNPRKQVNKKVLLFAPSQFSILGNQELLISEVIRITGLDIIKVELEKINLIKGEVSVWIYFKES